MKVSCGEHGPLDALADVQHLAFLPKIRQLADLLDGRVVDILSLKVRSHW